MLEDNDFEIITEKPIELEKEEFFRYLAKNETLDLTVKRIGKTYTSKWKNEKEDEYPSGLFIDYGFSINNTDYEVGISYNLGIPIEEDFFILSSGMNIFKILEIAIDLTKAKEIKVSKKFIDETLTGIRFKAALGSGYNGFIIKPVRRLNNLEDGVVIDGR